MISEESSTDSEHSAWEEALAEVYSSETVSEYYDVFSEADGASSARPAVSPSALSALDESRLEALVLASTTGTPLFGDGRSGGPEFEVASPGEDLEAQPESSAIAERRANLQRLRTPTVQEEPVADSVASLTADQPGRVSGGASFLATVGDRTFLTVQDAFAVAVDFALRQGFSLRKENQTRYKGSGNTGTVARLKIACSLSGAPRPIAGVRQRQRISKKVGCNWAVLLKYDLGRNCYAYGPDPTSSGVHTHPLLCAMVNRNAVQHRRLPQEVLARAQSYKRAVREITVSALVRLLKADFPGIDIRNFRDIRNAVQGEGRTESVARLIQILQCRQREESQFYFSFQCDEQNRLSHVFWMSERQKRLCREYGSVFSIDATYKTNAYRLPLILITGRDGDNCLFIAAAALTLTETIPEYVWVLRQLKAALGPTQTEACEVLISDLDLALEAAIASAWSEINHQLCFWHMMQNLSRKIRPTLRSVYPEFQKIVTRLSYSETEDEFDRIWTEVQTILQSHPALLEYIDNTYRSRRERWCVAWTDRYFNCGARTTQSSESMNNRVRINLPRSNVDLCRLYNHIDQVSPFPSPK